MTGDLRSNLYLYGAAALTEPEADDAKPTREDLIECVRREASLMEYERELVSEQRREMPSEDAKERIDKMILIGVLLKRMTDEEFVRLRDLT